MALKAGYKGIKKCGPGLKYDNVNGILSLEGESSLKLDNLEDVDITTPLQGDVLIYDGEDWVNEQPDSDPTEDSANLVTSGGVYEALQDRVDWASYAETGAVNILENKGTTSGIFTVDSDGVVDVYSATALSETKMFNITGGQRFTVPKGTWYFSCAPVGSSRTTYFTYIDITGADNQYDEGTPVELVSDGTLSIALDIYIRSGETPNHLKFKPMLSKSPSAPFAPYAMTNNELTEALGGVAFRDIYINGTTGENSEINVTVNGVTANSAGYVVASNIKNSYAVREYEPFVYGFSANTVTLRFNKQGTKDLLASGTTIQTGALLAITKF